MRLRWLVVVLVALLGVEIAGCVHMRPSADLEAVTESKDGPRGGMNEFLLRDLLTGNVELQTNALNEFDLLDEQGPDGGPPQYEPVLLAEILGLTHHKNKNLAENAAMALRFFARKAHSDTLRDAAITKLASIAASPAYHWTVRAQALYAFTDDHLHEGTPREAEVLHLLAPALNNYPRRDDLRYYLLHSTHPAAAEILESSVEVRLTDAPDELVTRMLRDNDEVRQAAKNEWMALSVDEKRRHLPALESALNGRSYYAVYALAAAGTDFACEFFDKRLTQGTPAQKDMAVFYYNNYRDEIPLEVQRRAAPAIAARVAKQHWPDVGCYFLSAVRPELVPKSCSEH